MYRRLFVAAPAVACCALLVACATPAPTYDPVLPYKAPTADTGAMTLIRAYPEKPTATDMPIDSAALSSSVSSTTTSMVNSGQASAGAGAAGGIIAVMLIAAVDAGVDSNRNGRFRTMLDNQGFDLTGTFGTALETALRDRNTDISVSDYERVKTGILTPNEIGRRFGDAPVLDVVVQQYGFFNTGLGNWMPSISADVRLTDPATKEILLKETVMYGNPQYLPLVAPYTAGSPAVIVPYNTDYSFDTVDAFITDEPDRAVKGMTVALTETAITIAKLVAPVIAAPAAEPVVAALAEEVAEEPATGLQDEIAEPDVSITATAQAD